MLKKSLTSGALVVGLVLSAAACGSDKKTTTAATPTTAAATATTKAMTDAKAVDIVDTAVAAGSFKTLAKALTAAGLVDTLKGPGPFTVFAPTDDAFAKLPAGTLDDLLKPENKEKLAGILKYHVVSGKVMAADVVKLTTAKTVEGKDVKIEVKGSDVMLNGTTKVTKTDIAASNGVIHVIDSVLLPA
jgi:transforming growth factor-beta-induced protein